MQDTRRVEIMIAGTGWTPCKFSDVMEGDMFRIFESDGTPVSSNGETEFTASANAYLTKTGLWCLETEDEE